MHDIRERRLKAERSGPKGHALLVLGSKSLSGFRWFKGLSHEISFGGYATILSIRSPYEKNYIRL